MSQASRASFYPVTSVLYNLKDFQGNRRQEYLRGTILMDQKIHQKTFLHALSLLHLDRKILYKYLEDKRLTTIEKKILKCWGLLRKSEYSEIIELLLPVNGDDPIVESQRLLILGITYLNKAEPKTAREYLLNSKNILIDYPSLKRQHFLVNYNLFLTYLNLKNKYGLEECLDSLREIQTTDETELINIKRCEFILLKFIGEYEICHNILKKLLDFKSKMGPNQLVSFLLDEFDFYIKTENYKKAYQALSEFKASRSYNNDVNYQYLYVLLKHITDDTPIYIKENEFRPYPNLFYPLKVIKHLAEQNKPEALKYWQQLMDFNPEIYKPNFEFGGDTCLFSRALLKNTFMENEINIQLSSKKDQALISIMNQATHPVSQIEIYQLLWGNPPLEKNDFNKLSRLVSRVNKKHNMNIELKTKCYFLNKKAS